jgi:hypothetical protein
VRTRTILEADRYDNSFNEVWAYCSPQLEINGSFGSPFNHFQRFLTSIINSSLQQPIPNVLCSFMRITPHLVHPRKNKDGSQEPQGGTIVIPRPSGSTMVRRKHTGGDRMQQQVGRTSPSRTPLGGNTWMVIPIWKSFTSVFKWQDLDDIEWANKVGLQPVFSTNWTRVVPRKKLLKEFVVGVRVLGPERIVVLIRGQELIYTAENIAQILRFPHISPGATPTPMVNLSQQEWDIEIFEYFSPDEWNEDQSGYPVRDAPRRWSSRFRAINEVIRMRKKHSYIGRQLLAETLTSHYKPPFNWAATLLAYIEKELNNIQKGRIKYSFLGQWIELLLRDVFPPTEDDDDDELADVFDQGRPSSTAASDQPRDEDAQSSADTQQVPTVQRARRLRNPKRAQVDGEVRSQPSKRRRLVQLSRLPVHLQVPHRMFTRQAARAEIPQRPPIHYLMSSPSLEHSDDKPQQCQREWHVLPQVWSFQPAHQRAKWPHPILANLMRNQMMMDL